jgi:antitoxin component HigA of HigAB toxin-antitoxin module
MKFPGAALYLSIPALIAAIAGCSGDPLDIDTSGTKVDIGYRNLDSLIAKGEMSALRYGLFQWHTEIPEVIDYELGYCLGVGRITDSSLMPRLQEFRSNDYIRRVETQIDKTFPDLQKRHRKIAEGFRRLKTHLAHAKMPKHVVYLNSTHRASAFSTENDIAMGLEMYLGAKAEVIRQLPPDIYFEWQKEGMDERYFERDALASWILTHVASPKEESGVIEAIIEWGKIIYLTQAAFPDMEKSRIIRYTEEDYKWALDNEEPFWKYLVKENLLFSKDATLKSNFLNDAPFTAGLPEKGPDRLGQFLGWRIVQSYMEQHDITVEDLMKLPYTELLSEYEID